MDEFIGLKKFIVIFSCLVINLAYAIQDLSLNTRKTNELNIGQTEFPSSLDPQKCRDNICNLFVYQLFEGLVISNGEGKIVPASAERWTLSSDGKIYTFYLRKNLKWSDGSKLTANDFVFSMQRLVDPSVYSYQSYLSEFIKNSKEIIHGKLPISTLGVKALNDHVLEITLTQPTPIFLEILAVSNNFPVQKKNIEKYGSLFTLPGNLVSNGSYILKHYHKSSKIVLEPNKNYWNYKTIFFDKVNYIFEKDPNLLFKMYQTGKLDIVTDIEIEQIKNIKAKFDSELKSIPILGCYFYTFNTMLPPFNNKKLRQALSIAIDREYISQTIFGKTQIPLYDFLSYGLKNHDHTLPYWYDWSRELQIKEAKRLYKEAGYDDKNQLEVIIHYNKAYMHQNIAISIANMWKQILGVNARLVEEEWDNLVDKTKMGKFQVVRMGVLANINDVYDFYNILTSSNPLNNSNYNNKNYDKIVRDLMHELDPKKRKDLIQKASKILLEDVPKIPIVSKASNFLVKPYIQNFKMNPLQLYILSEVGLKEELKIK